MPDEDLKSIQEVLIKDTESIKVTMDTSHDMMCLTKNKSVIYVNANWLAFTGGSLDDQLGDGRFTRIHQDDVAHVKLIINSSFSAQKPYRVKYRLLNAYNVYRWTVEDGRLFFDPDGTSLNCVSKRVDIDKEKRMEQKLHFAETKYRRLFETAYDGILILDSVTGAITDVNRFLTNLLGYSQKEFLGKKLWEIGAFKNIKASKEAFKLLQEVGYARYDDLPLETKDGRFVPVEFVSNAYVAGNINVIQCNIRDISERKRAEMSDKALATLKQEKQKNAFIADVTHELRTPLAIIKGNVELALRDKNPPKREVLNAINLEISHLSAMLLDLAILTTENQDVQKNIKLENVELSALIKRVVGRLKILSSTKNIQLEVAKIPSAIILGEVKYLEKLFSNLISNGIYYGNAYGHVFIDGKVERKQIVITVKDDGIGISDEDLPNIFERFYRSTIAREVNHEGTGLGLAISKWIVEAHGGEISVRSTLHKGTTFTVKLPIAR